MKTAAEVIAAVQEVLDDGVQIQVFSSDRGSEYVAEEIQTFFRKNHIVFRPKVGPSKAWLAEQKIFLLKKRLFLLLRTKGVTDWEHWVNVVAKNLNNTSYPALGKMTPNEVTSATEFQLRNNRQEKPFLDWRAQMQNKKEFFETIETQPLLAGDYVYMLNKKGGLDKSHDT
jgi:hypothetical protein